MTEAGTPALNRHVPRSEAEARIERALKVARAASAMARKRHSDPWVLSATLDDAIDQIAAILDPGHPNGG